MSERERRPIALVGLMGAGKTAVASLLGERLGASVADLDAMIEAGEGCRIGELFARSGESWFRRRESELLAEVVRAGVRVIACGGGVVLSADNRALLRSACDTAWLEVTPAEAARRIDVTPGAPERPLLAGGEPATRLAALLAERAPHYAEVAHWRIATDGLSSAEVAERVLAARAGTA